MTIPPDFQARADKVTARGAPRQRFSLAGAANS